MKIWTELSKDELVSLVYNNWNVGYKTTLMCASCGNSPDADFYYVCDRCNGTESPKKELLKCQLCKESGKGMNFVKLTNNEGFICIKCDSETWGG